MRIERVLSGIVAVVYLAITYQQGGGGLVMMSAVVLIIPLWCIWMSEDLAWVDPTPRWLISAGGWMLLLVLLTLRLLEYSRAGH